MTAINYKTDADAIRFRAILTERARLVIREELKCANRSQFELPAFIEDYERGRAYDGHEMALESVVNVIRGSAHSEANSLRVPIAEQHAEPAPIATEKPAQKPIRVPVQIEAPLNARLQRHEMTSMFLAGAMFATGALIVFMLASYIFNPFGF